MPPAHPKKGDQALGRSRGGLSTKIHALVEGLGLLARFSLTGGEAGDSPQALPLLGDLQPASLSADKAYDTDAILQHLADQGIEAVIPPRRHRRVQRRFDRDHCKRSATPSTPGSHNSVHTGLKLTRCTG